MNNKINQLKNIYQGLSRATIELINRLQMTEHIFLIMVAVIIGLLAGYGAVGIRLLINFLSDFFFPGEGSLLENIIALPWYYKLFVPFFGGLLVGPIVHFFAPEAKGHGVPEVMSSVILKGGVIRPRVAFVKAIASALTIGTGGSVGREGPIIQIGSSLGSTVGQFLKVNSRRMKIFVGCGAAAGIAAAFNAPIAGALFAIEIILMDFAIANFSPIIISSVVATIVSHFYEGNYPAFPVPGYELVSVNEIGLYFILGILAGSISFMFIKTLYYCENIWDNKLKIPNYLKAATGGLLIGVIALFTPEIMGTGYESITNALNGNVIWYIALILIFVKILATSITLGSGSSGGVFAPALFMGAMLGMFFGWSVNHLFPEMTGSPGAYALVAMGGLVAGTMRAPITAIIMVFELTKEYSIILPLMIVCTASTIISSKLSRESIYTLKLLYQNIKIKERAEVGVMKSLLVRDVYSRKFDIIYEKADFGEVVNKLISEKASYLSVHENNGNFMGVISIHSIKDLMLDIIYLKNVLIAGDIADKTIFTVTLEEDCKSVLEKMGKCDYDGLPVVDATFPKRQIGIIWRKDINDAYQTELDRLELTSDLATKISQQNVSKDVSLMEGYLITEIQAPDTFVGKTIRDLNIRSKFGVNVISIKSPSKRGRRISTLPDPDYKIKKDDDLIIAGEVEKVNIFKDIVK